MTARTWLAVAFVLVPLAAQAQSTSLVGTWEVLRMQVDDEVLLPDAIGTITIVFEADGSLVATLVPALSSDMEAQEVRGTYTVEGDRMRIVTDEDESFLRYRFEGAELVMVEDARQETAYLRRIAG